MLLEVERSAELTLSKALSLEWLETNGLGGYASSTIINCNTRKYHGLLVSHLEEPAGRFVLLSQIEDIFCQSGKRYFLCAHQYPDFFADGCFENLQKFQLDTHPCFIYQFGQTVLTKEILMPEGENTVLVKYEVVRGDNAVLEISPLVAFRNFHDLLYRNNEQKVQIQQCEQGCELTLNQENMPALFFQSDTKFAWESNGVWYHNFEYEREKERGYPYREDLYRPGTFKFHLGKKGSLILSCSVSEVGKSKSMGIWRVAPIVKKWQQEIKRRKQLKKTMSGIPFQQQLKTVGRSFIERMPGTSMPAVIAGYHWFVEWGRDAMISLPGLTLYLGLESVCLSVLRTFAENIHDGLIPNYLGKTKQKNAYNSVDASLWFAWAVQQYYLKTDDFESVQTTLWPALKDIFEHYKSGTLHDIKMKEDGLIYAGNKDVNLTWMDANVNGQPVTARYGAQVEVNALWYNMLCFMCELAEKFDDAVQSELKVLIRWVKKSFQATFWNEELGCLYDFVNSEEKNAAIRPNQIFAVSLPHCALSKVYAKKIVQIVKKHLLTPYGLRTLSPEHPCYIGNCVGKVEERDSAYHNGTVWPWLLGHFGEAVLKTSSSKAQAAQILEPCFDALTAHLSEAGIGSISEIFDGDAPHHPRGCISQAWSVAEVLRLGVSLCRFGLSAP